MSLEVLHLLNGNNNGHFKKWLDGFNTNPTISWYASAGRDFRDLLFLSNKYMGANLNNGSNWEQPDLYIHTDYYTPFFDKLFPSNMAEAFNKPKSTFESLLYEYADISGWYLYKDDRTSIRVKRFEYLPSMNAEVRGELVQFKDFPDEPKKVVYMFLEVNSKVFGSYDVHLIYANVVNEFFADYLVKNQAEINTIVHVRYGSGFGFARANGAFLKNILHKIHTKYFISDPQLEKNQGDITAARIYPSLRQDNYFTRLLTQHVIPSESWSSHGNVSVYRLKYLVAFFFAFWVQLASAQEVIYAPKAYQAALFQNYTYFHHLTDSIEAERSKRFELDSNYKEESMEFTLNGKKYYGYDGGLLGYYMQQCWDQGALIIKSFLKIDEVTGCGNGVIVKADGLNKPYYYYHCFKRVPIKSKGETDKRSYQLELVEVRFFSPLF